MNTDTRLHLAAACGGRLYENAAGMTLVKSTGANGFANRRAQLRVVERLLADGWISRLADGRYEATELGRAELAATP